MNKATMEIINTKDVNPAYIVSENEVSLIVYPRLHMFTFDLSLISGILKHGSMGRSLENMPITITAKPNQTGEDKIDVSGSVNIKQLDFKIDFDKLRRYAKLIDHYDVTVHIDPSIREHTGLGLSTQILGGVYLCAAKASGYELKINDLFKMGIGHYSALGLNLLFTPGMIFEMGCRITDERKGVKVNPRLSQEYETASNTVIKIKNFPFYTTVVIPKTSVSISGEYEMDFWDASLPDKDSDSYRIVYNVFENIIPSIIENDFASFTKYLNEIINLGSKPLEENVQSLRTKEVLNLLRGTFKFAAVSSLGPSLFAFSETDPVEAVRTISENDHAIYVYSPDGSVRQKVNDNDSLLIASFACLGKTTFTKNYPTVALDVESIHYARTYNEKNINDEIAKGNNNWLPNPEYPNNYVSDVVDNIGKYKVIFLTTAADALEELDRRGVKYDILYPGEARREQILTDARNRGNDDGFVSFLASLLATDAHRKSFEVLQSNKFVIVNDESYIEHYIAQNYIV